MGLCSVEKGKTYTLSEFRSAQFRQLREVQSFALIFHFNNYALGPFFTVIIVLIGRISGFLCCVQLENKLSLGKGRPECNN